MGSGDRSSGPQKCVASTSAAESSPGHLSVLKLSRYSVTPNTLERTTVPLHCSGEDESLHMRSAEERSPDGFNSQTGLADPETQPVEEDSVLENSELEEERKV